MRDAASAYEELGAVVLGINGDSAASHQSFRAHHGLTARLLVDTGLTVARRYGATLGLGPLAMIRRTVVVIGRDGVVRFVERGTPPTERILAAIQATNAAHAGTG